MRGTARRASSVESTKIMNTRMTANAITNRISSRIIMVIVCEPTRPWYWTWPHSAATPNVATIAIVSRPLRRSGGKTKDTSTITSAPVANMIASCRVSWVTSMGAGAGASGRWLADYSQTRGRIA